MGLSPDDEIPQVSMSDLLAAGPEDKKGDEIAIYYAVGDIVMVWSPCLRARV